MKKKYFITFAAVAVAVVFFSCSTKTKLSADKQFNGEYKVVSINKQAVALAEVAPFVIFDWAEKSMNGSAGCNNFFTTFSLNGDQTFTMTNIGSTRRMCADMKVEDAFLQALNQVHSYKTDKESILFYNSNKEEVIELKRK